MKLKDQLKMEDSGWEAVAKGKWSVRKLPTGSASIRKKCINISEDLREFVGGYYGVQVFLNKQENLIGLKPSNEEMKAFRVKDPDKGGLIAINMERFTETFGTFKAEWDAVSEMLVIDQKVQLAPE